MIIDHIMSISKLKLKENLRRKLFEMEIKTEKLNLTDFFLQTVSSGTVQRKRLC